MARPKQFDPDQALNRAMEVFWRQGYEATSVQDLLDEMGINRASLYATFGDKHKLYQSALARYASRAGQELNLILQSPGPALEVLERALTQVVDWQTGKDAYPGCFMTNSALELSIRCSETAGQVRASLALQEQAFSALLSRGQESNEITRSATPEAQTQLLLSVVQGLVVLGKSGQPRASLVQAVEVALSALRLEP